MLKAYIYILILELITIAFIAGKPRERNIVEEIREQGYEFEDTFGIKLDIS